MSSLSFSRDTIVSKGKFGPQPKVISRQCKSILTGLLTKDPRRRLGCRTGAGDVRAHKWFRDVNFALLRNTTPPLKPKCCEYSIQTPASGLEWSHSLYDKETRNAYDDADPFDKFCSGKENAISLTKFYCFHI
jgi:hypothetical protein